MELLHEKNDSYEVYEKVFEILTYMIVVMINLIILFIFTSFFMIGKSCIDPNSTNEQEDRVTEFDNPKTIDEESSNKSNLRKNSLARRTEYFERQ